MLELRRNVARNVALSFKSQVLSLELDCKRVAHDFLLAAEIVSVTLVITGEVLARAAVADQDRIVCHHGLSLALHSEVGVLSVDDPDASKGLLGVHGGLIQT